MLTNKIINAIRKLPDKNIIIAIDGRCGSGKTTLAAKLAAQLDAVLIHMDDFFLRPEQRSTERLNMPGENTDHERFLDEVLIPLRQNRAFSYRPYICTTQSLGTPINISPKKYTIVEGAYSCHPKLWYYYDIHIFLDVPPEEQMKRIIARNGLEKAQLFRDLWIPLEEKYFTAFNIPEKCELNIFNG